MSRRRRGEEIRSRCTCESNEELRSSVLDRHGKQLLVCLLPATMVHTADTRDLCSVLMEGCDQRGPHAEVNSRAPMTDFICMPSAAHDSKMADFICMPSAAQRHSTERDGRFHLHAICSARLEDGRFHLHAICSARLEDGRFHPRMPSAVQHWKRWQISSACHQ